MNFGPVEVLLLDEADEELKALPESERVAMRAAFRKLAEIGSALPFPHQSSVRGSKSLRELRPRGVAHIGVSTSARDLTNSSLER